MTGVVVDVGHDLTVIHLEAGIMVTRYLSETQCVSSVADDRQLIDLSKIKVEEKAWSYHYSYLYNLLQHDCYNTNRINYYIGYVKHNNNYYYPTLIKYDDPMASTMTEEQIKSVLRLEERPVMEYYVNPFKEPVELKRKNQRKILSAISEKEKRKRR